MAILEAALTGAAGVVGSIMGGINSRKARKRQEQILAEREKRATNLYNRDYYKDYTQTTAAQNALRKARDVYKEYTDRTRGTQAVTGGTEESVAAQKAAANNAVADTTAAIATNGENLAQHAQDRFNAQKDAIDNQKEQIEADKAKQSAAAGAQALNIGAKVAGSLIDSGKAVGNNQTSNSTPTEQTVPPQPVQGSVNTVPLVDGMPSDQEELARKKYEERVYGNSNMFGLK